VPPTPQPLFFDTTGNWQFTTASTAGMNSLSVAGNISQSVSEVTATVHIDGSNCFDHLSAFTLSGKLAGSKITLASTSINGQMVTLFGDITGTSFTGAFKIEGGCAGGDQGTVSGAKIPSITSQLTGTLTTSENAAFSITAQVTQGSVRSDGTYGITGTASFGSSCFTSGTISSADFPAGSFILGDSVTLNIATDNGTLLFLGTADKSSGKITGDFSVTNGTCNVTGTAVFMTTGQWDY